jgi:hypothetical protein
MIRSPFSIALLAVAPLAAQEYPKSDFQVLYLHGQMDTGLDRQDPALAGRFAPRRPHNGFAVSTVSNRSRISGLKLELSWMRDSNLVRTGTGQFRYRQSPLWILAGTQLKDNRSSSPVKPFVHLLGGAARFRTTASGAALDGCAQAFETASCPARFDSPRWSLVTIVGAGLDVKSSERTELRLFQVDYAPLARFGQTLHSVRFGAGFVFH